MRINRYLIVVFLITFLFGVLVYFLIPKMNRVNEETFIAPVPPEIFVQKTQEVKPANSLEILDENNDWENEDNSKFKVKLLEVGEGFHGDQIEAKSSEIWLGLFKNGDKFFLKNTKLKIVRVRDIVTDEADEQTGKSVRVENKNEPFLLLKNADFLKEGEIVSLFGGNPNLNEIEEGIDYLSLRENLKKEFSFGEEKFLLTVKRGINKEGENIIALILESSGLSQTLHSYKAFEGDNNIGTLHWVGDLDNDKKPDFYIDLYINENMSYKNLFLSSKAGKNKLVKKIGVFSTTGC